MAAKNTQVKLYKIDQSTVKSDGIPDTIAEIIRIANKENSGGRYTEQILNTDLKIPDGFTLNVYHVARIGYPGWREAWTDILPESSAMLTTKNRMSSFIAFISFGGNLYALTGGQGNIDINRFTTNFFGLDVIDYLIGSTLDRGINEASKNAVAGNIKTEQRTFFGLTDAFSEDSFETFFKMLKSRIKIDVVREYFEGLYPKGDFTSFFQGGDYFLIRKAIPLVQVFDLIRSIERIFAERTSSGHNKLIPIGSVNSKTSQTVEYLNSALIRELFQNQDNPEALDNYYFSPKIPHAQIDSSVFAIASSKRKINEENIYPELPTVSQYIEFLLNIGRRRRLYPDIGSFAEAFSQYHIHWRHQEEDDFRMFDPFTSINGVLEVESRGKSFLRFEDKWYEMRQNFKEAVDSAFSKLVADSNRIINAPEFLTLWNDVDENAYNYSYSDNNSIIVAHKVMKRNYESSFTDTHIEYADLIHIDNDEPKIIHVKKTCNGDMRVASAQIAMCAEKFNQIEGKEAFLREYYNLIRRDPTAYSQSEKISEDNFVQLGLNDRLKICLLISDSRVQKNDPRLSICGKFYFIKMFKDMEKMGYGDRFIVYNV